MEVKAVAGQHMQLLSDPFVAEIAAYIRKYMNDEEKHNLSVTMNS